MEMWTKGTPASSELLRAALGSLSDFSSDFSQIIQLFFHSVSLSSRRPSGGRNPRPNPLPGGLWRIHAWRALCGNWLSRLNYWCIDKPLLSFPREGTSWETDCLQTLLIRQSLNMCCSRLEVSTPAWMQRSILWMNAHSYLNLHTDIQIYVCITDVSPPSVGESWLGALSKTLIYCALNTLDDIHPQMEYCCSWAKYLFCL